MILVDSFEDCVSDQMSGVECVSCLGDSNTWGGVFALGANARNYGYLILLPVL
jgi:hypothetical protein